MDKMDENKQSYLEYILGKLKLLCFTLFLYLDITNLTSNYPGPIQTVGKVSMYKHKYKSHNSVLYNSKILICRNDKVVTAIQVVGSLTDDCLTCGRVSVEQKLLF